MEMVMNRKLFLVFALAIMLPVQAHASDAGRNTGATSTCGCHGSLSTDVTATITGLPTILAGTTQTYTTTLTGTLLAGGSLNVALTGLGGASLGDIEANTRFIAATKAPAPYTTANQITHTGVADNTGDWSYDFTLTAPLTLGTIVLNSVMLAFDGTGDETGDLVNNTTFSVQVIPEPSTILLLGAGMAGLAALGRRRR
jgi:hypothetical protein